MSTPAAQAFAQRKVRRQKQFIAVGSVVLLAVLGFQLPKLLGGGGGESAVPAVTTTQLPSVAGSSVGTTAKLPDTDRIVVQRDSSQLLSFGLFRSKDPFVQQLSTTPAPSPTPVAAPTLTTPPPTTTIGVGVTPAPTTPAASPDGAPTGGVVPSAPTTTPGSAGTAPAATTPTPSTPTSALISTNNVCERLTVDGSFPGGEDIFRVVSIAKDGKSVEIGVVGGSYDSGQPTATLKLGEKLTLVNTADGTRYVIALKAKCDVIAPPQQTATTSTPATTTTTPATPLPTTTTTATTPIVTDALDPSSTN